MVNLKIIEFDKWCKDCRYYEIEDDKYPCYYCLQDSAKLYSKKPTFFKSDTRSKRIREKN